MTRDEAEKIVLDAARDFACQCFWRFTSERRDPILLAATMMEQKTPEGVPDKLYVRPDWKLWGGVFPAVDDSNFSEARDKGAKIACFHFSHTITVNPDGSVSE